MKRSPWTTSGLMAGAVVVSGLLAGCGETPQNASGRKTDASPASGTTNPAYVAPGWKPGDKTSWDGQIRDRNKGQNDYVR